MITATVTVMLKRSVLDPQGAAVERALKSEGYDDVRSVRIGKVIELLIDGDDPVAAEKRAAEWADRLLANPVMETYTVEVERQP